MKNLNDYKLQCPYCGYEFLPRTATPHKVCPSCHKIFVLGNEEGQE